MKVCFTGHRANKSNLENTINNSKLIFLQSEIITTIESLINKGYKHFIIGMADGFDLLCGKVVLDFKEKYKDIYLECAVPYREQLYSINESYKDLYCEIFAQSDEVKIISEKYSIFCMRKRNQYMVDNSDIVVAYYEGKSGGTKNTIDYAKSKNKEIIYIK